MAVYQPAEICLHVSNDQFYLLFPAAGVSTEGEEGEQRTQGYRLPTLHRLSLEKVLHPVTKAWSFSGVIPPSL